MLCHGAIFVVLLSQAAKLAALFGQSNGSLFI
jgi:hypothetical protein